MAVKDDGTDPYWPCIRCERTREAHSTAIRVVQTQACGVTSYKPAAHRALYVFEDVEVVKLCRVRVYNYQPARAARISGPPEDCSEAEAADVEFELIDVATGKPIEADDSDREHVLELIEEQHAEDRERSCGYDR